MTDMSSITHTHVENDGVLNKRSQKTTYEKTPERLHLVFIGEFNRQTLYSEYIKPILVKHNLPVDNGYINIRFLNTIQKEIDVKKPIAKQSHQLFKDHLEEAWNNHVDDFFLIINVKTLDEAKRFYFMSRDELLRFGLTPKLMRAVNFTHYIY